MKMKILSSEKLCFHLQIKKENAMNLIAITSPTFFVEEHLILNALFEEGLDVLHLKKPDSEPIFCERLLRLIDKPWLKHIVVHDHFYLKDEFGLKGIHLNDRNPEIPTGYKGHVSRSCHSLEEVKEWKPRCSYVFLGPIYDSKSGKIKREAFSTHQLTQAAADGIVNKKVIAVGGINAKNIKRVKNMGFGGAAVMTGLWEHFDAHESSNFHDIVEQFKLLRKLAD